mgnify:CR=1 FL=1
MTDNRLIGEMHRVLPVYFHLSGARIAEIAVDHRSRRFGNSKYGLNRIFKFIADILLAKVKIHQPKKVYGIFHYMYLL